MTDANSVSKKFSDLMSEDTDLTMFTMQDLTLVKRGQLVTMSIVLEVILECMNCSCHICEPTDANKAKEEAIQGASSVWVGTGAKVAPQQVTKYIFE